MTDQELNQLYKAYVERIDVSDFTREEFTRCISHHLKREFLKRSLFNDCFNDFVEYLNEKFPDTECPKQYTNENLCEDGNILEAYAKSLAKMYQRRMEDGNL